MRYSAHTSVEICSRTSEGGEREREKGERRGEREGREEETRREGREKEEGKSVEKRK